MNCYLTQIRDLFSIEYIDIHGNPYFHKTNTEMMYAKNYRIVVKTNFKIHVLSEQIKRKADCF